MKEVWQDRRGGCVHRFRICDEGGEPELTLLAHTMGEEPESDHVASLRIPRHDLEVLALHLSDAARRLARADRRRSAPDAPKPTYTVAEVRERHPNPYKFWTETEDRRLLAAFGRGCPPAKLACIHRRQPSAILARLRKLGAL